MTTQPCSDADVAATAEAERRLQEAGLRLTAQRRAILGLLADREAHWTPQQIFERLEPTVPSLSLATVYNTLEVLEDLQLVHRVHSADGQTYFDPNLEPHHHGVCQICGELFDLHIKPDSLRQLINQSAVLTGDVAGFTIEDATVWFRGLCRACK